MLPFSIRTKLLAGVAVLLLPLLGLLLVDVRSEYDLRRDAAMDSLMQSAEIAAPLVDRSLDAAMSLARTMREDPVVRSGDPAALRRHLAQILSVRDDLLNLGVVDAEGNIIASAAATEGEQNVADRAYFQRARRTGEPQLSGVVLGRIVQVPALIAAAPLFGEEGQFKGLMVATVRLSDLASRVGDIRLRPGQALFATDASGRLAFHTDLAVPTWPQRDLSSHPQLRQALSGDQVRAESFEGIGLPGTRMAALTRTPRHGWVVAATWSRSEALRGTERLLRDRLLSFLAIAITSIALAYLLSEYFARRLRALLTHARELTLGHLGVIVQTRRQGGDEIDELIRAFNDMSRALVEERQRREVFIASAAHDLRNLVSPIALTVSGLQRPGALSEERIRNLVTVVLQQSQRIGRLVSDLLDVSLIQQGRFTIHRARVDLTSLVRQLIAEQAPEEAARLNLEAPEKLEVDADPERIAQVVTNLMSNAVKYSPAGTAVRIVLAAEAGRARACVIDQGVGLSPTEREVVFEPFIRVHEDLPLRGMGMGLYICRTIVESHGGRIWVESGGRDQGAAFCFELPRPGA